MAVITPQSDIYLLKCPIEISDEHQLTFATKQAQYAYFSSLTRLTVDNFTYIRKDGVLRFPGHFDDIVQFNYVMYRNDAFSDKWFYAFIEDVQYLNDNTVAISMKTDVWQTWQFDLNFKNSLIEREHVTDDTPGAHTIPEGLEYGDYTANGSAHEWTMTSSYLVAAVSDTSPIDEVLPASYVPLYGNIPSGLTYIVIRATAYLPGFVNTYDQAGKADAINSMFIIPQAMVTSPGDIDYRTEESRYGILKIANAKTLTTFSFNRPTSVDGYIPVNKKLLGHPYSYFYATNNAGSDVDFRWENFTGGTANFTIKGIPQPGCSIKLYPTSYKGLDMFYNEGIMGSKLPMCGWNSDAYTNWLAQVGVNQPTQLITGAAAMLITGAMDPAMGVMGGINFFNQATNIMNQETQARMTPDQARGNVNGSDINWSVGKCGFTFYPMSIKAEYARMLDNYFSLFGYKINRVKEVSLHTRSNWNFIKTVNVIIEADIPQSDLDEIKELFNKGITLWHKTNYFLDYTQANTVI